MRSDIAMTEDELVSFLERHHFMHVATLKSTGSPHIVSMWYGLVGGKVAFSTYAKSQKAVNLLRDPRIACQIEEGTHPSEVKGVAIEGIARPVDEPEELLSVITAVSLHALGAAPTPASLEAMGIAKRIGFVVEPTRVASWDHNKVAGGYMRGRIPGDSHHPSQQEGSLS